MLLMTELLQQAPMMSAYKKSNHNTGVFRDGQFILSKETVQPEKLAIFAPEKCEIAADFANYAKEIHIKEENAFAAKHQ